MKTKTVFRNLDSHGQHRAPEVISEEVPLIEKHLKRFNEDLPRLEVTVSQTKGKTRIEASLRLQLPTGLIVAREHGFEVEPVLRKAFADLRKRLERHLERLRHEPEYKRPARRKRLGALLPPARDAVEADRRKLYFDLIEDHLDTVYNRVRRELTYLEANGDVPEGRLSTSALVDAAILRGLETFEQRGEFSVDDWLTRIALETIRTAAKAARRSVPDEAASLDQPPEEPAQEPTESDQEMFEFYQPDDNPVLEDLLADGTGTDPEQAAIEHETQLIVHRAIARLPDRWRQVVSLVDLDGLTVERAAQVLECDPQEVTSTLKKAHAFLAEVLADHDRADKSDQALKSLASDLPIPQPVDDRARIAAALIVAKEAADLTH